MSHRAASRKPYSPQSHGDTEKNKVKGKTGAHGGGGGHGGAGTPGFRRPRSFGSSRSSWRANSRNQTEETGVARKSLQRAKISNISSTDQHISTQTELIPIPRAQDRLRHIVIAGTTS